MNWQFWLRQCPLPAQISADDCSRIRPLLSLMGDGMASAKEVREAEAHLQTCTDCQQAQLWIDATRQAICTRPIVQPPPDMRARIALAIAASAETSLPAVSIAAPVVRRTFTVRPAYAAAASLAVAGAFLGHYLLTSSPPSHNGENTRPVKTASSGHRDTGAGHQRIARTPANKTLVATVPPVRSSVSTTAYGLQKYPGRSPEQPSLSPANSGVNNPSNGTFQLTALRQPQSGPVVVAPSRRPNLVAKGPTINSPASVGLHPRSPAPLIASLPQASHGISINPAPSEVLTPPAPVSAPPPAVVVARLPETPPAAVRPVPGDALGSIRVSLASYRSTDYARRLSMASGVHERQNFVQGPIVYTPTSLSDESVVRRAASSAPRPASVPTVTPTVSSVPNDGLPATDQRRSEREKQWSDVPTTGGA